MSTDRPVVVYGASGYTGRLICEYLREFHVPFVAAGRDKARIQDALDHVPGIDTVDHEVVEVAHEVGPLTELFAGARVVCNTVGPFAQYGGEVVEALSLIHISEPTRLGMISYAVFCLKKKNKNTPKTQ